MARTVKWTPEALLTYAGIMRHLRENWTQREMDRFDKELDAVLGAIARFPKGYRRGSGDGLREAFTKPWNLLIYRIASAGIELLTFWDVRRDPRKKPRWRRRSKRRG